MRRGSPSALWAWLLLVLLNALVLLPNTLGLDSPAPWLALGLSVEVLALSAAVAWLTSLTQGRTRRLVSGAGGVLWLGLLLFEILRLVGVFAMGQDPLLYDLGFLLRHMVVLVMDVGSALDVLGLVAAALALTGAGVGASWALGRVAVGLGGKGHWGLTALAGAAFGLSFLGHIWPPGTRWPARLLTPLLVENIRESVGVYQSIKQAALVDPYEELELEALDRRPQVRIFIVESYGQLLFDEKDSRAPLEEHLRDIEAELGLQGWYSVSGRSRAPISGGRSWIADATLYSGLRVRYESVYQHLKPSFETRNTLPSVLSAAGYHSVVCEPKDRARPGVELENEFGFDQTVFYQDLGWTGPEWGWGIIPDQYTLGWLRDELIAGQSEPVFLSFHMVASHVPWRSPPPITESWRELPAQPLAKDHIQAQSETGSEQPEPRTEAMRRLKRYRRVDGMHHKGQGGVTKGRLQSYADAVHYDLEALLAHLEREREMAPDQELIVVIMGDHQPPFLSKHMGFEVPVHVLATDPLLLEEFSERGLVPGMVPERKGPADMAHQAMFSALIRALQRYNAQEPSSLHPEGVIP